MDDPAKETSDRTDTLQELLRSAISAPTWVSPLTLASHLTVELVDQLQATWSTLDPSARLLVGLAITCVRRGQMNELREHLTELLTRIADDEDDWVRALGQLLRHLPSTGVISRQNVDDVVVLRPRCRETMQQLKSGIRFRRSEEAYLSERLRCLHGVQLTGDANQRRAALAAALPNQMPLATIRSSDGVTTREERQKRFDALVSTAAGTSIAPGGGGIAAARQRPGAPPVSGGGSAASSGLFMPRRTTAPPRPAAPRQTPSFLRTGVQRPRPINTSTRVTTSGASITSANPTMSSSGASQPMISPTSSYQPASAPGSAMDQNGFSGLTSSAAAPATAPTPGGKESRLQMLDLKEGAAIIRSREQEVERQQQDSLREREMRAQMRKQQSADTKRQRELEKEKKLEKKQLAKERGNTQTLPQHDRRGSVARSADDMQEERQSVEPVDIHDDVPHATDEPISTTTQRNKRRQSALISDDESSPIAPVVIDTSVPSSRHTQSQEAPPTTTNIPNVNEDEDVKVLNVRREPKPTPLSKRRRQEPTPPEQPVPLAAATTTTITAAAAATTSVQLPSISMLTHQAVAEPPIPASQPTRAPSHEPMRTTEPPLTVPHPGEPAIKAEPIHTTISNYAPVGQNGIGHPMAPPPPPTQPPHHYPPQQQQQHQHLAVEPNYPPAHVEVNRPSPVHALPAVHGHPQAHIPAHPSTVHVSPTASYRTSHAQPPPPANTNYAVTGHPHQPPPPAAHYHQSPPPPTQAVQHPYHLQQQQQQQQHHHQEPMQELEYLPPTAPVSNSAVMSHLPPNGHAILHPHPQAIQHHHSHMQQQQQQQQQLQQQQQQQQQQYLAHHPAHAAAPHLQHHPHHPPPQYQVDPYHQHQHQQQPPPPAATLPPRQHALAPPGSVSQSHNLLQWIEQHGNRVRPDQRHYIEAFILGSRNAPQPPDFTLPIYRVVLREDPQHDAQTGATFYAQILLEMDIDSLRWRQVQIRASEPSY